MDVIDLPAGARERELEHLAVGTCKGGARIKRLRRGKETQERIAGWLNDDASGDTLGIDEIGAEKELPFAGLASLWGELGHGEGGALKLDLA